MKKFVFVFLLLIGCLVSAQHDANPFDEPETTVENNEADEIGDVTNSAGNPDGTDDPLPLPIDDYMPLLVIAAVGIIVCTAQKKKNVLSENSNL